MMTFPTPFTMWGKLSIQRMQAGMEQTESRRIVERHLLNRQSGYYDAMSEFGTPF